MNKLRITKDEYYLGIAKAVRARSTCLKCRYGCVIVKNDEIIATGYNGAPRGESNCCDCGVCKRMSLPHNTGDYDSCHSVHAEQNAMLSASRKDMIGATLYLVGEESKNKCASKDKCTGDCGDWCSGYDLQFTEIKDCSPCPICLRMIHNAGISSVCTIYNSFTV